MLVRGQTYEEVYGAFRWGIPEFYNIGVDICGKWSHQRDRLALIYEDDKGRTAHYTFWNLKRRTAFLASWSRRRSDTASDLAEVLSGWAASDWRSCITTGLWSIWSGAMRARRCGMP